MCNFEGLHFIQWGNTRVETLPQERKTCWVFTVLIWEGFPSSADCAELHHCWVECVVSHIKRGHAGLFHYHNVARNTLWWVLNYTYTEFPKMCLQWNFNAVTEIFFHLRKPKSEEFWEPHYSMGLTNQKFQNYYIVEKSHVLNSGYLESRELCLPQQAEPLPSEVPDKALRKTLLTCI